MRVAVLGADGYLGWPTVMRLSARGHEVWAVDNYLRRTLARQTGSEPLLKTPNLIERARHWLAASGHEVRVEIADCADYDRLSAIFAQTMPDAVIHYAEQPSAPYSMMGVNEARLTLENNLKATFNVLWSAIEHAPRCHIIKLGTMGEYGTPDIDIEEGWIEIEHKGRRDKFLFPRQAGSLYHTTKVLDTDLIWFYVRLYGLRATDLMQGPVYGLATQESEGDERLSPHFHYDDIFGTVVNRFLAQAVAGMPLTVYGKGGQTRGYLNLEDTLQCVELALMNPPGEGELRILNQFSEQFTVNDIATRIQGAGRLLGIEVALQNVANPRQEAEEHYYNARHSGLLELGLKPHLMTEERLAAMMERLLPHRGAIDPAKLSPRVRWSKEV